MTRVSGLCKSPIRIRFADWAIQAVFFHNPSNLLDVHYHRRIQVYQSHVDASRTFLVTSVVISDQDQFKVCTVLCFLIFTMLFSA